MVKLPEPKHFDGQEHKVEDWIYGLELYFLAVDLKPFDVDKKHCAAIAASLLEGTA